MPGPIHGATSENAELCGRIFPRAAGVVQSFPISPGLCGWCSLGRTDRLGVPSMILGMSLSTFTTLHVVLSLIGIVAGLVVAWGMLAGKPLPALTALFLATTVLTSVTGFLFPFSKL